LLGSAIRLLGLREYELQQIARRSRENVLNCHSDLLWSQKKVNLTEVLDRLKRIFRLWFPSVEFKTSGIESKLEWEVDQRWLEVLVVGLWFHAAEFAIHSTSKVIHTTARWEERERAPVLNLSVTHRQPEDARLPSDIESASDFLMQGDGDSCMGLQLVRRAAVFCRCETRCRSAEQLPLEQIFECRFSLH
jgi:hypothetical protein